MLFIKQCLMLLLVMLLSSCFSTAGFHELHREGLNELNATQYDWALESFLKAEKLDPTHKHLLDTISHTYFRLGKYNESIQYSDKVIALDPGYYQALKRKGLSFRKLKKFTKSTNNLEKLLDLDPLDYKTYYLIAKNYYDDGKYKKALASILKFKETISKLDRAVLPEKEKQEIRGLERKLTPLESRMRNKLDIKSAHIDDHTARLDLEPIFCKDKPRENITKKHENINSKGVYRTSEEIESVLDENKGKIYTLYNRRLKVDPTISGKVVLELRVLSNGNISDICVLEDATGDERLLRTLMVRIKAFKFPEGNYEESIIKFPIDFYPS